MVPLFFICKHTDALITSVTGRPAFSYFSILGVQKKNSEGSWENAVSLPRTIRQVSEKPQTLTIPHQHFFHMFPYYKKNHKISQVDSADFSLFHPRKIIFRFFDHQLLSTSSAIRFGSAISALKISAMFHTAATVIYGPINTARIYSQR